MDAVQNGRELLRIASTSQDHYRDVLVRIPHANRTIHIDCRPCSAEELDEHSSLFALPVRDQNRWTHFRIQTPTLYEDFSARQPQPSIIPKVTLTPGASKFWRQPYSRPPPELQGTIELAFIAIVQGGGGSAVKKLIVAHQYPQMATSIFNEAANGFSVVFTGACFKHELEKACDYGPFSLAVAWEKVSTLNQLYELKVRARSRDRNERLVVGVLC